jgi:hypothetical protein
MSKHAFVMCCDVRYLPEAVALINSLDFVGNKEDFHWWGYKIPQTVIDQLPLLGYKIIFHEITDQEVQDSRGLSEVVCRKRYFYADQIGKDYLSVCVLDADMVFVRDPKIYFDIAANTGLVVCALKEQKESYQDRNHRHRGNWIMPEGYRPEMDLCNCPLFVDTKVWGQALRESYEIFIDGQPDEHFKGPDMAAMNLKLLQYGSEGRTLGLPNVQWLGTNEQNLKPYQRVVSDGQSIKTETGTPIYSYHGQFYYPRWRNCQLNNRNHCAQGYLKASGESLLSSNNIAKGAMENLYERFKKMLDWKVKIEHINYRHPEKNHGYLDVIGEGDLDA